MKRLNPPRGLPISLLGAAAVALLVGCVVQGPPPPGPPPPPPGPPVAVAGYDYYYYPDEEVYFYPATGVYFWFGGGGWHSGGRLPAGYVLHDRVNVRLDSLRPYEHHGELRARYPGHRGGGRFEEREEHERR